MRKYLSVIFVVLLCLFSFLKPIKLYADEVDEVEEVEEEVVEVVEETEETVEQPTEIVNEIEDEETFKEIAQEFLNKYLEESMVSKIITWAADAGVLTALFFVYRKYSKYKHTTIEDMIKMFKDQMEKWLKEQTDKLSKEEISKITNAINDLENSNETIMKVLVLMQDNTAKGKAALIEYLGSKTDSREVKEAAVEVSEKLEEIKKKDEEINEAVKDDYVKLD